MRYTEELIEEIKKKNDIVDVISKYITLKRKGRTYFGLCPFHGEKTPSFAVSQDKQIFHCFGCGKGGGVIQFVQEIENNSFKETLKILADNAKIELPTNFSVQESELEVKKKIAYNINLEALNYFKSVLYSNKYKEATKYILDRKLNSRTIKAFHIGYSAPGLYEYLNNKGFKDEDIANTGLVNFNYNMPQEKFKNRLMFPIIDGNGNVVGFTARLLNYTKGQKEPKYLNSNDSIVYNKSRTLFGYNLAKKNSREQLIVVEGCMDAISLYQRGFENVVASLGTALTKEQARLISRNTKQAIIAYDQDGAGKNATIRGLDILADTKIDLRVLEFTGAKDPDEYIIKYGTEKFREQINKSISLVAFKAKILKEKYNLENPIEKAQFLKEIVIILSQLTNEIEKEIYVSELAKKYNLSEQTIQNELDKITVDDVKIYSVDFEKNMKNTINKTVETVETKDNIDIIRKNKQIQEEYILIQLLTLDKKFRKRMLLEVSLDVISDKENYNIVKYIYENYDMNNEQLNENILQNKELVKRYTLINTIEISDLEQKKKEVYYIFKKRKILLEKKEILDILKQPNLDNELKIELKQRLQELSNTLNKLS